MAISATASKSFSVTPLRRHSPRDLIGAARLLSSASKRREESLPVPEFLKLLLRPGFKFFVAKDGANGAVVGIGLAELHNGYGVSSSLLVRRDYRGAGVSRALIESKIRWLHSKGRRLVVTYAKPKWAERIRSLNFFGARFVEMPRDRNTASDETKLGLDLNRAVLP